MTFRLSLPVGRIWEEPPSPPSGGASALLIQGIRQPTHDQRGLRSPPDLRSRCHFYGGSVLVLRDKVSSMYLAIAYGLGAFILVMVLVLLWIGWQHKRDEARAERASKVAALNSEPRQSPQTVIGRSPR
jgi:hypothetical protein